MKDSVPRRLFALVLLSALTPSPAFPEIPVTGRSVPFPNAPYDYRYDEAGQAPRIAILSRETGTVVARYTIEGASFCDEEDNNCEMDGIFSIVLAGAPEEPVLAAVTHVGVHSQQLAVFRPLRDKAQPVFQATADYAVIYELLPDGLSVELEREDKEGRISREARAWLNADKSACARAPDIALPDPPPPSRAAALLENELRRIARKRSLYDFVELLTDDVLVSFGGNGGKDEFLAQLGEHESGNEAHFWRTLDRLLAQGPWDEADTPEMLTWPWFFAAWPHDEDAYDIFLADPDTMLRAGPDEKAPILATLPFTVLRYQAPDAETGTVDWQETGWLPVAAPGHCLAYVRAEDATPLLGTRMIARNEAGKWKIEAFVAGD